MGGVVVACWNIVSISLLSRKRERGGKKRGEGERREREERNCDNSRVFWNKDKLILARYLVTDCLIPGDVSTTHHSQSLGLGSRSTFEIENIFVVLWCHDMLRYPGIIQSEQQPIIIAPQNGSHLFTYHITKIALLHCQIAQYLHTKSWAFLSMQLSTSAKRSVLFMFEEFLIWACWVQKKILCLLLIFRCKQLDFRRYRVTLQKLG